MKSYVVSFSLLSALANAMACSTNVLSLRLEELGIG